MAYQTLTEFNATGIDGVMGYVASISPSFFPLTLFALFIIASMGMYFSQLRLRGRADFLATSTAAAYFVTIIAFVLSLVEGIIPLSVVMTSFVFTIILTIILITSER